MNEVAGLGAGRQPGCLQAHDVLIAGEMLMRQQGGVFDKNGASSGGGVGGHGLGLKKIVYREWS